MSVPAATDVAAVLALSDERNQWERRIDAAWREGFRTGRAEGIAEGRELEAAEWETAWRRSAGMILVRLNPDGPEARESAQQRVKAAEAGCRRDASEQWHGFIRRAHETPPHKRNEVQRAGVILCGRPKAGAA